VVPKTHDCWIWPWSTKRNDNAVNGNRAKLAVARKMVALMLAVERSNTDYVPAAALPVGFYKRGCQEKTPFLFR
jgi:hypothetical protein